jgi:DNA-binding response OmpR family regulator
MPSPKGRILHVEDDADTRRLMTFVLNREGYEVIPTEDATEALKVLKRIPFDLYIVDTWLPGTSGIELCNKIRESDGNNPILFVSAAASDGDKQQAYDCGASGYLVKPFEMDELVYEVRRLTRA